MRHALRCALRTGSLSLVALLGLGTSTSHAQAPSRPYYTPVPSYAVPPAAYGNARSNPNYAVPANPVPVQGGRRFFRPRASSPAANHEYGSRDPYFYKS